MTYEQDILDKHSTPRLRKTRLDHPSEPEVPWHEYPVPTHMSLSEGAIWMFYVSGLPYHALKYSDGSVWDQKNKWCT